MLKPRLLKLRLLKPRLLKSSEAEAATILNDAETRRAEQPLEESLQREEEQLAQQEKPAQQDEPAQGVQLSSKLVHHNSINGK